MSYRIAISFAAAAIGMSCIATDVSARSGGGGGKGAGPAKGISVIPRTTGVGGPTGRGAAGAGGAPAGGRYYAPASYNSSAACGRYPYPPCNKVPTW
jgi:hypothetical protein